MRRERGRRRRPLLRPRAEEGTTLLHFPAVAAVGVVVAVSLAGLTQVALDYRHLGEASRAGARFAAGTVEGRRPESTEVVGYAAAAARPLAVQPGSVTVTDAAGQAANNSLGRPGSTVTVSLTTTVSPAFYGAASRIFDTVGSLVGVRPLRPVELRSSSTATYR